MVVTSPGSSCNDSNRKPNVNQKLKQLVTKSYLPIPDEVAETCLAYVRICHYPKLSLVSTIFRSLIASPELYHARSRLNVTEPVLYVSVGSFLESPSWYVLHRKPYKNTVSLRLGKTVSLRPMPWGSAVVTIGSQMYVIGGCVGSESTFDVSIIDCRTNTQRSLPRMKVAQCRAAAGVLDGKIYVIGGCEMQPSDWVEVFDPEEEIWILQSKGHSLDLDYLRGEFASYFVMNEKIHMSDGCTHYIFEPKQFNMSFKHTFDRPWEDSSCVIDGLLFSVGPDHKSIIYNFNPKVKGGRRHVLGLEGFPANIILNESKMANFGGKLVILGPDVSPPVDTSYDGKTEIFCVEIALESWGGEIWGRVESVEVVLTVPNLPSLELCRTVMV